MDPDFQDRRFTDPPPPSAEELVEGAGRRVLVVRPDPIPVALAARLAGQGFELVQVDSASRARELVGSQQPFAVVLADQALPDGDGVSLLAEVRLLSPESARMIFADLGDASAVVDALHQGAIYRFLVPDTAEAEVISALEDGIARHRRKVTFRVDRERVRFAQDALVHFNRALEQRLEQAQYATVLALARLAEERDDCTGMHLERVSGFCRLLALGLRDAGHHVERITDRFVHDLVRSAPLHDIGKVGIPDAILHKPGKLTAAEWEVMRTHPRLGAEALAAVLDNVQGGSVLRMGHEVALYHHERWDGTGYCAGLAGEAIPLAARILKVADCYDALTTRRPYKHPWSHAEALAEIRKGAGTEFDPALVEVLCQVQADMDALREQLSDHRSEAA